MHIHNKNKKTLKVIITMAVFLIILIIIDKQLRPLIKSVAANKAHTLSCEIINEAVLEELSSNDIAYTNLIQIDRNSSGQIVSISSNIKQINMLKTAIALKVQKHFENRNTIKAMIPIGTFTGAEIFNGVGPKVPLKVTMSGSVDVDLTSNFASAGINQTLHQIHANITTQVLALIPGYPTHTASDTNILIAETIIIGDIPAILVDGKSSSNDTEHSRSIKV